MDYSAYFEFAKQGKVASRYYEIRCWSEGGSWYVLKEYGAFYSPALHKLVYCGPQPEQALLNAVRGAERLGYRLRHRELGASLNPGEFPSPME